MESETPQHTRKTDFEDLITPHPHWGRGCIWEDDFTVTIQGREINDGIELVMEGPVEINERHYTVAQAICRMRYLLDICRRMPRPKGYCMDYRIHIHIWADAQQRDVKVAVHNRLAGGEMRRYTFHYPNPNHAIAALIWRLGLATE
jgi:hypothetical protein